MKHEFFLIIIVVIVLMLSACATTNKTTPLPNDPEAPSSTEILASTFALPTKTFIPMLTNTPTLLSMQPPVGTLEPLHIRETMDPLFRDPMKCTEPCFWGIVPNKTKFDEAKTFFDQLGIIPFEGKYGNTNINFYTIQYTSDSGLKNEVTLYALNNNIENIIIRPRIKSQKEGNIRDWIAYSPDTLIKQFGKPSRVEFTVDSIPRPSVTINMYYDDINLIVTYAGDYPTSSDPRSYQVCPLIDTFTSIRIWIGSDPVSPPLPGITLEKATSLKMDQFTQLILGDPKQGCFSINRDVFP